MSRFLSFTFFIFIMTFSSFSFGEWKKVTQSKDKISTSYLDFDNIINKDGYIFIWNLLDFSKKDEKGYRSQIDYLKVDCELFKFKILVNHSYECQMGDCSPKKTNDFGEDQTWKFPIPQTLGYTLTKISVKINL